VNEAAGLFRAMLGGLDTSIILDRGSTQSPLAVLHRRSGIFK
jgi:hypothetical protein